MTAPPHVGVKGIPVGLAELLDCAWAPVSCRCCPAVNTTDQCVVTKAGLCGEALPPEAVPAVSDGVVELNPRRAYRRTATAANPISQRMRIFGTRENSGTYTRSKASANARNPRTSRSPQYSDAQAAQATQACIKQGGSKGGSKGKARGNLSPCFLLLSPLLPPCFIHACAWLAVIRGSIIEFYAHKS